MAAAAAVADAATGYAIPKRIFHTYFYGSIVILSRREWDFTRWRFSIQIAHFIQV